MNSFDKEDFPTDPEAATENALGRHTSSVKPEFVRAGQNIIGRMNAEHLNDVLGDAELDVEASDRKKANSEIARRAGEAKYNSQV